MRGLLTVTLLALAGVLSFLSNAGLWVERTVYDTDHFVSTVGGVLDDDDVEQVIAQRFTEDLVTGADIESRLREGLPEGVAFLALPLTDAVQEFLTRASIRLLEAQRLEQARNAALTATHERLIAIIEGERGAVSVEDRDLVLDLRPILEAVAEDISGRDVTIGEGGFLERLELPEDAGRFVIEDTAISWVYPIARYGNDIVYIMVGVTVACSVLAVVVARDRRSTLRNLGIVLAVSGVLSLAVLLPLGQAARQFAENDDAATSVVSIITSGYKSQSLAMVGVGIGFAAVAVLLGDSPFAVAVRTKVRRTPGGPPLTEVVREHTTALRVGGLVVAAAVLIVWTDPTTRVILTTLGLLGLYLLTLLLIVSDAQWAVTTRTRVERFWDASRPAAGPGAGPPVRAWIARNAGPLRLAGIIVAVAVLLLWPSVDLRVFIMVAALMFVYLAAVDLVAGRSGD